MSDEKSTAGKGLRAGLYVRMSGDTQKASPERQKDQCIPYATSKGYVIVGDPRAADYAYQDLALQGDNDERPGFLRLLADVEAGLIDVIVIDQQSRLDRTEPMDFLAKVIHPLWRSGVILDCIHEGVQDWSNLAGQIMTLIHSHGASEERKKTAHRVLSDARSRVARGRPGGPAPFGYKYAGGEGEGKPEGEGEAKRRFAPHERFGPIVRQMFEAYAAGEMTLLGVVEWLEAGGILPPRAGKRKDQAKRKTRWNRSAVRVILRNPVYTGVYVYGKRTTSKHAVVTMRDGRGVVEERKERPGQAGKGDRQRGSGKRRGKLRDNAPETWVISPEPHPALVTQELFDAVQARLAKNRDARTGPRVGASAGYALSNILACEHCGRSLVGHHRKRSGRSEYRCQSRVEGDRRALPCTNAAVGEADVLDKVVGKLEREFLNADKVAALREGLERQEAEQRKPTNVSRLKGEIAALDARIKRAVKTFVELEDDEKAAGRERIAELKNERAALAAELDEAGGPEGSRVEEFARFVKTVEEALWSFREARRHGNQSGLRALIQSLITKVTVRWRVEPMNNVPGKRKYVRRVPVGGTIYIALWFAESLRTWFGPVEMEEGFTLAVDGCGGVSGVQNESSECAPVILPAGRGIVISFTFAAAA